MRSLLIICIIFFLVSSFSEAQVTIESSNLPLVIIRTPHTIQDTIRVPGKMSIISNESDRNNITDLPNVYDGNITIEYRGSSSKYYVKKSYGLTTKDKAGISQNVSLLGMPEENDWILQGPYSDKTLIRNVLTYKLSSMIGHYSPRTRICELIINDSYEGVYVLMEKIKRDKNRVDISKLTPEDTVGDALTGGYILKIDQGGGSSCESWQTDFGGIWFQIEYPKCEDVVPQQFEYIRNHLIDFEICLANLKYGENKELFDQLVDERSLVDYYIINELTKNVDGYMLSVFFYKDRDSKDPRFKFGPVWDYNGSLGNAFYRDAFKTDGIQMYLNETHWWWFMFFEDRTFSKSLGERWRTLRKDQLRTERIFDIIDSLSNLLAEAQVRNFERWPVLEYDIWPNYYIGSNYKNEIEYLKSWVFDRVLWLDVYWRDTTNEISDVFLFDPYYYPNPFSKKLNGKFSLKKSGKVTIELIDYLGYHVVDIYRNSNIRAGLYDFELIEPNIQDGMYYVVFRYNDRIVSTKKLIKIK